MEFQAIRAHQIAEDSYAAIGAIAIHGRPYFFASGVAFGFSVPISCGPSFW